MEKGVKDNKQLQQPPSTAMQVQAPPPQQTPIATWKLVLVAAIAAGVQFGWALQLSLLTPYVQLLGIPHKWAAYIWLCGPISGMFVQPIVGYYSDQCQSSFGRRRPFIASGAGCVAISVFLIGFAADIGYKAGDDMTKTLKPRAVVVFVIGFWILDVANNMLQGPCRALLADLCSSDTRRMRTSNAFYSFFMAVGNILGYAAGSYNDLYKIFPFSKTHACNLYCANLKSCFIISIALLITITVVALTVVPEKQWSPSDDGEEKPSSGKIPVFGELFVALKDLPRPMLMLLIVTCLNWIAWFPFILFDTDWMGREIYGGVAGEGGLYDQGVRAGSLGLLLNSVVLGLTSIAVEYLVRGVGGVKILWGVVNFVLAVGLVMTVVVSKVAGQQRRHGGHGQVMPPSAGIKAGALTLFSILGIPLSITYSIPFALASMYSSGSSTGQGLSLGVLNLAIVVPQMIVSVLAGPFDSLFGGGNLPAFVVGAISAAASGVLAILLLPKPPKDIESKLTLSGTHH